MHAAKAPLSSRQLKLTPGSPCVKDTLASRLLVGEVGLAVIVAATGAVTSMVKPRVTVAVLPAASLAWAVSS